MPASYPVGGELHFYFGRDVQVALGTTFEIGGRRFAVRSAQRNFDGTHVVAQEVRSLPGPEERHGPLRSFGSGRVTIGDRTFSAENISIPDPLTNLTPAQHAEELAARGWIEPEYITAATEMLSQVARLPAHDSVQDEGARHRVWDRQQRTLAPSERRFMLRHCGRMEAELRCLVTNHPTVGACWEEATRAGLSETSAAELAVIALAREIDDLKRQLLHLHRERLPVVPVLAED